MPDKSPLHFDEVFFTYRLLFETLNFDEGFEKTAEPRFRKVGLSNGAIENFIRVMQICDYKMLQKVQCGHEPPTVRFCPWENQEEFLKRNAELSDWIIEKKKEPADITSFVRSGVTR